MRQTTKDLNNLREDDLITIILFCLYKFTDDPELATISELAYALDKNSLYNLCATFGGTTIKVPTLNEYKKIVKVMLIFEYINKDGLSFSEACTHAGVSDTDDDIIKIYSIMSEVLNLYEE